MGTLTLEICLLIFLTDDKAAVVLEVMTEMKL